MQNLEKYHRYIIRQLAVWTIKKYQPGIIAVTGSVGKTSTKEAIYAVLKPYRSVRVNSGNFNNEIGVPLTILGEWKKIEGRFFWAKVILAALWRLLWRSRYPELLILEYGVDKPGDMRYLIEIAKPHLGVVTAIGDIPVHVEFFSGPEALVKEKLRIIEGLSTTGFAILNYDDEVVFQMKEKTRAHVMTYGFGNGSTIQISNLENRMGDGGPEGINFQLHYEGKIIPVQLQNSFGKAQAYAAAAAAAVGIAFGLNLVKISEALNFYEAPARRGKLLRGIKHTWLIDDSYNASPLSMEAAIHTIETLKAKRKIAVLGDMLEIGKYTIEAHEGIGQLIPGRFDILVTVGSRAKFIADAAIQAGMTRKSVYSFDIADEAALEVQKFMKQGDLILIKASRAIELDKVVEEIRSF